MLKQPSVHINDFDAQLDRLRKEHAKLEERLRELDRHLSLSLDEQMERANLKKSKLQLKDLILRLSHQKLRA